MQPAGESDEAGLEVRSGYWMRFWASLLVWALKWVLQSVTLLLLESPLVCCCSCSWQSPSASASGVPFAAADEPLAQG